MGVIGALILLFLAVHLFNFWARIKLGLGEEVGLDAAGYMDVYAVTTTLFKNIYVVLFYSILMVPLGFHLNHGLQSAFKTLGFYHRSGLSVLAKVSLVYSVIMALGFGVIPWVVFLI